VSNVGKVNVYTCATCGGETVTIDVDDGVTPFMLGCRAKDGCRGMAQSSFYRPHAGRGEPAWEWYRPTPKAIRKMSPGMQKHVVMGGLDIRKALAKRTEGRR
jgi:hypothetical protein